MNHLVSVAGDTIVALGAIVGAFTLAWYYLSTKVRAEGTFTGDDTPGIAALGIAGICIVALVFFGAVGWLTR